MAGIIDTIYTFRFIKILSTKWENTDAYKLGIVDEDGEPLKKISELKTAKEKNAYTPFIRLVFKFKRIMNKFPGGKSSIARYGSAIMLIKEHQEEVEQMGLSLKDLEEGLKKYINNTLNEGFDNRIEDGIPSGISSFRYTAKKRSDLELIIQSAIGRGMEVDDSRDGVFIIGSAKDHKMLIRSLSFLNINGMVSEEVTTGVSGVEGKEQPLGKKGEVSKRKKKKDDEVVDKNNTDDDNKNEETSYIYQMIGNVLVRVDEKKRAVKKRIVKGKRQKKREFVTGKGSRYTRTGNRKLRGAKLAKKRKSLKKAKRKAHTGAAAANRKRSMKKSRKYN